MKNVFKKVVPFFAISVVLFANAPNTVVALEPVFANNSASVNAFFVTSHHGHFSDSVLTHHNGFNIPTPTFGLTAYIPFDTLVNSTTFKDVTNNGYNASWTGTGISTTTGIKGVALNCTGNSFEVTIANSNAGFNVPKYSLECWFNLAVDPSAISIGAKLLDYQHVASGVRNGYATYVDPNGHVVLAMANSDGSVWEQVTSSVVVTSGKWYHVVCTFDSTVMKVFVNGQLSGSSSYTGTYLKPNIDAHLGCAENIGGVMANYFNGKIDDFKFYNFALPADSIAAHYNSVVVAPTAVVASNNYKYEIPVSFQTQQHGFSVSVNLAQSSDVSLDIYSVNGTKIATLYKGLLPATMRQFLWSGQDNIGKILPAGSYYIVARINDKLFTKKVAFIR